MDTTVRRVTGISGLLIAICVAITIPLYFIYSGPPPASNVLTRDLINIVSCGLLLIFMTGFSHLLRRADPALDWIASLALSAGLLILGLTLVATSLEAGVVFGSPDGTVDPTIDGPLAHGNILIHGSIKRLLHAVYLFAVGYAVLRTQILPRWLGWAAYVIAAFNLFFLPSLYFGTDPSHFYSAHGWGNSAFAASFIAYWILAASVLLLRRQE
jgi:hypothetical protein